MNLINEPWIPVVREDGTQERIVPWQIAETTNPVVDIDAPRADFRGALYQFLIGLLQSTCAVEDADDWEEVWDDGFEADQLKTTFAAFARAFELTANDDIADGAAFMQDFNLPESEIKPISALLIEAPGAKTVKDNLDHFIKSDQVNCLCSSCTATALFTLQLNAPSGGAGHRVGLRGGGPLTTLVLPHNNTEPLWRKLWLNVLNKEHLANAQFNLDASQFPWLADTKTSEKKGSEITPQDNNALQMFWAMPRRISLFRRLEPQTCDLCGKQDEASFMDYKTKNYGVNYDGLWLHPLTPYWFDPKKKKEPLSLKGQKGGLNYSNWLGLVLQDLHKGDQSAKIVNVFNNERTEVFNDVSKARLWCFGYDMDNMKARCWYEHQIPLFQLSPAQLDKMLGWASNLIICARETSSLLRKYVREAWFSRPGDAKGDMSHVSATFWQATEFSFYQMLQQLQQLPADTQFPAQVYQQWLRTLRQSMFQLFDQYTVEAPAEDLNMKRIIFARDNLAKYYFGNNHIKNMAKQAKSPSQQEVNV
ncbi:type I-E CRISPR-associated protein Cse1/CasA [Thalassomonas haliotis]|uniref:Type I-E CRISPR-associated protein Cse1/CasA n=1 Tax=Thalassomonas haliotis TaxID=485448 RepID=A0ABY7VGJ4_9GAMM|nr:type I-E CRISPR-associated protein Cse1/CasA [Thalassomonas haliotis]WDE12324.1 type I-E CRISPR-associated protein Cse1/CasA [Thalassomonas haliotis]